MMSLLLPFSRAPSGRFCEDVCKEKLQKSGDRVHPLLLLALGDLKRVQLLYIPVVE